MMKSRYRPYMKCSVNIRPRLRRGLMLKLELDVWADMKTDVHV